MLSELNGLNLLPVTAGQVLLNICVALLCSLLIAWLYRSTHKGPGYSVNFSNSIVLLSMITAVVIMVIGNSLARAFGLVGAMSIIRFRTAVKDTRDIVFIFFSLAVGMSAGVGYHKIALIGTIVIGLIVYLLTRANVGTPHQKEYLLQFYCTTNGDGPPPYQQVIERYCRSHKVINVKTSGRPDELELAYYVRLRHDDNNGEFVRQLRSIHHVRDINLFFDEEKF